MTGSATLEFQQVVVVQGKEKAVGCAPYAGDYDWSRMAGNIWPNRVREKCRTDRSLAIAHGLEEICEAPSPGAKKRKARRVDAS